jgi:hypothetical protein
MLTSFVGITRLVENLLRVNFDKRMMSRFCAKIGYTKRAEVVRSEEMGETYRVPLDARQPRQWHKQHSLGNEDLDSVTRMAPQLQAPVILEDAMIDIFFGVC